MEKNQLVRHAAVTVRLRKRRTGMTGLRAILVSMYPNNANRKTDTGRLTNTIGWFRGVVLPPEFKATKRKDNGGYEDGTAQKVNSSPFLFELEVVELLCGHPQEEKDQESGEHCDGDDDDEKPSPSEGVVKLSTKHPPKAGSSSMQTLLKHCQTPRRLSGIRSFVTRSGIVFNPPFPSPDTIPRNMMTDSLLAKPQIKLPAQKSTRQKTSPDLLPYISVSLPARGYSAEFAIKYAEASHARRVKEWKESEMEDVSVATMVSSKAASAIPRYPLPITMAKWVVLSPDSGAIEVPASHEGSSGSGTGGIAASVSFLVWPFPRGELVSLIR